MTIFEIFEHLLVIFCHWLESVMLNITLLHYLFDLFYIDVEKYQPFGLSSQFFPLVLCVESVNSLWHCVVFVTMTFNIGKCIEFISVSWSAEWLIQPG
jgi:hypothetical protein